MESSDTISFTISPSNIFFLRSSQAVPPHQRLQLLPEDAVRVWEISLEFGGRMMIFDDSYERQTEIWVITLNIEHV